MSDELKILRVDLVDGDLILVELSDETTVELTLDQLLSLHLPRLSESPFSEN